ncbi:hypothetical protein TNCV_2999991 [Trichonephila clavipes]|nr:hypothetical protein TNCV_2999991 [Trichonephila clavipes]
MLCEKLFLWETAPSLDSFSKAGQPNSSKISSQPARRCVRGTGRIELRRSTQGENEENKSFVATSFLKNKTRTVLLSSVQCFLRDKYGLLHEIRALLDVEESVTLHYERLCR